MYSRKQLYWQPPAFWDFPFFPLTTLETKIPFQEEKTLNVRGKKEINLKEHERDNKIYQSKIRKEGS